MKSFYPWVLFCGLPEGIKESIGRITPTDMLDDVFINRSVQEDPKLQDMPDGMCNLQNQFAMGAIFAGTKLGAVVMTTPLDYLKTKKQANPQSNYSSIITETLESKGVRGFYRGTYYTLARMCISAGLKGAVTTDAANYVNGQCYPETLQRFPQFGFMAVSPVIAAIDTLLGPLERLKTLVVTSGDASGRMHRKFEKYGMRGVLQDMYRGAGIIAFDKTVVVGGFHLMDGEVERRVRHNRGGEGLTNYEKMLCAGFIGIALSLIHMPLSVAKTHITKNNSQHKHLMPALNDIYKKHGFSGLYCGHVASMMNCIIGTMVYSFAVMMAQNINGMDAAVKHSGRANDTMVLPINDKVNNMVEQIRGDEDTTNFATTVRIGQKMACKGGGVCR